MPYRWVIYDTREHRIIASYRTHVDAVCGLYALRDNDPSNGKHDNRSVMTRDTAERIIAARSNTILDTVDNTTGEN